MREPAREKRGPGGCEQTRVRVVLVRARNPANIGAAARAMHDFGFGGLRVVNEFPVPFHAAKSAVDASAVMADAVSFPNVADAVADCTLVVGTTAVGERALRHELLQLPEAAHRIRGAAAGERSQVALLFGSEKTGLSNEELSHCDWLLTIPMYEHAGLRHPSMNLGQAVAVCLWELVRDSAQEDKVVLQRVTDTEMAQAPAEAAALERLTTLLTEVLQATEYNRRHAANCDPAHIRRMVRRIGADAVDTPVWMGILRQVLWKLGVASK